MENSPYFQIAQEYEPLDEDDQIELLAKASQGDKEAREKLILHNFRLVINFSTPFFKYAEHHPLIDLEDILSAGVRGLIRAIDDFKPALGTKLSTYAWYWITQKIRELLKNEAFEELEDEVESTLNTEKDAYQTLLEEKIENLLDLLPYRERKVLREYYFEGKWLKEIAEDLFCSVERVRQIKENGLNMLRELLY